MTWTLVCDTDNGVEYAALLHDKTLYDLKFRGIKEKFAIGDLYTVKIDRYTPALKAYGVIFPDGDIGHLPARAKDSYKAGDIVLVQIRRLAEAGKDILVTTQIDKKDTDLSTFDRSAPKKWLSALNLETQLRLSYPDLDIKTDTAADFDHYDLWPDLEKLHQCALYLNDGVSITIDPTTALTAIDVNSAGQVSATKANIIAAKAIARQIRLRNIGGIILIDFINMKESNDQSGVASKLKKMLKTDPCTPQIHGFTALGLLELSRKRIGNPISVILR